jgi:hypothetical protein
LEGVAFERRLRMLAAGLLLYLSLQGALGLGWDIEWHTRFGRDSFWIPPHLLIYSAVAAGGLVALALVLLDTQRYRTGARGVDDRSTISLLGLFHAPRGAFVAGFGFLALLIAAPFDNYWHLLYGIDVTIWAPFHVMGLLGTGIVGLGLVYLLAAERAAAFWTLLALATLLRTLFVLVSPSLYPHDAMAALGPLPVLLSPVLHAPTVVGIAAVAAGLTRRPGAAVAAVALTALISAVVTFAAPWLVRWAAPNPQLALLMVVDPAQRLGQILGPFLYVGAALVIDLAYVWSRRSGLPAWPVAGLLGSLLAALVAIALTSGSLTADAIAAGALIAAIAGMLMVWAGGGLGTLLRLDRL